MNITDLFPPAVRGLILSKALELFEQDENNPDIKPPAVFVLAPQQSKDEAGNLLFYDKGRDKGKPVMSVVAIPYENNIMELNTQMYNELVKANEGIKQQNNRIEKDTKELAELKTAYLKMREQYLLLLNSQMQ